MSPLAIAVLAPALSEAGCLPLADSSLPDPHTSIRPEHAAGRTPAHRKIARPSVCLNGLPVDLLQVSEGLEAPVQLLYLLTLLGFLAAGAYLVVRQVPTDQRSAPAQASWLHPHCAAAAVLAHAQQPTIMP